MKVICFVEGCPFHNKDVVDKCDLTEISIMPLTLPDEKGKELIIGFSCVQGCEAYYAEMRSQVDETKIYQDTDAPPC